MASYRWPSTGHQRPEDAIEHATYLKTEFDSVSNAANASLSHATLLPSGLQSRVSIGITKGIAEARSKGCCPKLSDIDKSIFSQVMLKTITAEAALEARDRVPLAQFNGLHESYNALHTKFLTQRPPTATTHQFIGAGAATEATSVIDLVSAAKKTSEGTEKASTKVTSIIHPVSAAKKTSEGTYKASTEAISVIHPVSAAKKTSEATDKVPNSLRVPTNRHEKKAEDIDDEESEEDTNEEEDDEMNESENAESDREVTGNGDNVSGDDSSGEGSSDDTSDSEESSETDSDAGSEEVGDQDTVGGKTIPAINGDGRSFMASVNLKIEHQASVNRLEGMPASELANRLSWSLEILLRKKQLSPDTMHISGIILLDDGDLRVDMHAESREALRRIVDSADWAQKLEKALGCWQVPTYNVRMHSVEINSLRFRNRKEKAAIIRRLAEANRAISQENEKPIIRDIRWSQYSLPKVESSLIIEFLDSEQATRALDFGLFWEKRHLGCKREDNREIRRCSRCQGYGHLRVSCSAPDRCGKCAGHHDTRICKSNTMKCASCGGDHRAGNKQCPAKAKEKRSLGFQKEFVPQAIEPAAEAQATAPTPARNSISAARTQTETSMPSPISLDASSAEEEIEAESDQSLPEADPTQDALPETATLLEKIEDLRKQSEDLRRIVVARDCDLQTKSSGRTKRRAEEAFKSEAEAESSNMATKRIKQEQPTRDGSMGLWRQPSPFIVERPE